LQNCIKIITVCCSVQIVQSAEKPAAETNRNEKGRVWPSYPGISLLCSRSIAELQQYHRVPDLRTNVVLCYRNAIGVDLTVACRCNSETVMPDLTTRFCHFHTRLQLLSADVYARPNVTAIWVARRQSYADRRNSELLHHYRRLYTLDEGSSLDSGRWPTDQWSVLCRDMDLQCLTAVLSHAHTDHSQHSTLPVC